VRFVSDEAETALRDEFRSFFGRHCPPAYAEECDRAERFPAELYAAAGRERILATFVPAEYGGREGNPVALAILFQEAGRAFPDFANLVIRNSLCVTGMVRHAGAEQRQRWLPQFAAGTMHMAFGASEPEAGSDVGSIATIAAPDGPAGDYVVSGSKLYTTGADAGDAILCIARLPGTRRREGLIALVIPTSAAGVEVRRLSTLGVSATGTAAVTLTGVRVPSANVIGEPGKGWDVLLAGLDLERLASAAIAVGASRLLVEHVSDWLGKRVQFGRPLAELQVVRHRIADIATAVDAAELATMAVAYGMAAGRSVHVDASAAKLAATETFMRTAHQAVQLEGGHGYVADRLVQRYFRDAKMYEIGGGASDVQRDIIAKALGLSHSGKTRSARELSR
jgi:alkylation response protein AidB-like acyl-CoA dehydrogenase